MFHAKIPSMYAIMGLQSFLARPTSMQSMFSAWRMRP
jgi:hypothetical protein